MITVVDVIRDMGLEPTSDLTWSVGSRVREMWEDNCGQLPEKQLRTKTAGVGSHCFAIYPEGWRKKIETVVAVHRTKLARQIPLPL